MAEKTPDALVPAFRQYRHNFGDDGVFIAAYDYETTNNIFAALRAEVERLRVERDAAVRELERVRNIVTRAENFLDSEYDEPNGYIVSRVLDILNGGEDG